MPIMIEAAEIFCEISLGFLGKIRLDISYDLSADGRFLGNMKSRLVCLV